MENRASIHAGRNQVITVLRSTLRDDDQHLLESKENVYDGFKAVCEQFQRDFVLERYNILNRMDQLKFKTMDIYINGFKKLVAEFINVEGDPSSSELKRAFLKIFPLATPSIKLFFQRAMT